MDKVELRSNLHTFIDQIENIELLKDYYWEMKRLIKTRKARIWDALTESQKKEILLSYEESENDDNLIDHEEVVKKYNKWL